MMPMFTTFYTAAAVLILILVAIVICAILLIFAQRIVTKFWNIADRLYDKLLERIRKS